MKVSKLVLWKEWLDVKMVFAEINALNSMVALYPNLSNVQTDYVPTSSENVLDPEIVNMICHSNALMEPVKHPLLTVKEDIELSFQKILL